MLLVQGSFCEAVPMGTLFPSHRCWSTPRGRFSDSAAFGASFLMQHRELSTHNQLQHPHLAFLWSDALVISSNDQCVLFGLEMGSEASFYFVVSFWISGFLYIKCAFINVVTILFGTLTVLCLTSGNPLVIPGTIFFLHQFLKILVKDT